MKEKAHIFKIKNYDEFKCIADKCKYTCCSGWDINIDNNTYDNLKGKKLNYILDNIRFKKINGKSGYLIKKETKADCPFLNETGLCNIVIKEGDEALSNTCRSFPRIENRFGDIVEMSLSCSCPEVVNIIARNNNKPHIELTSKGDYIDDLSSLKIRQALIELIQREDIKLDFKLILAYEMLIEILESEDIETYEELVEFLENYKKLSNISIKLNRYEKYKNNNSAQYLKEISLLFVDIIENYRNVPIFENDLKEIYKFSQESNKNSIFNSWKNFKDEFYKFENLNEKIISSKILSNCIDDDIEEMIISFEMIVLEYLLSRYALFLKKVFNCDNNLEEEYLKNYIVIFSRIIGNNIDSVVDFLNDTFDNEVLELDYLCFLVLS